MDNLVLIRVADVLHRSLVGSILRDLRQESSHRFRLIFEREGRVLSVVVSVEPEGPWIGRPTPRRAAPRRPPDRFAALGSKLLRGGIVAGLAKGADRSITLAFVDGQKLVAELVPHRSNLLLLDGENRVQASARRPRSDRDRLAPGVVYEALGLPPGRLDPAGARPQEIDDRLAQGTAEGADLVAELSRCVFGVSTEAARLVMEESRASGRSPGEVLAGHLEELTRCAADPVLDCPRGTAPEAGPADSDPGEWKLLPWEPASPPDPTRTRVRLADAAATAGLYHGAHETRRESQDRSRGLLRILSSEINRQRRAESRIAADAANFEDPARFRLWGEALLAGLRQARRSGEQVLVPDPYDPEGKLLSIPVPGGRSLQKVAEDQFRRFRRASRGLEQARKRATETAQRRLRLERLRATHDGVVDPESLAELARAMRGMGIAVELEPPGGRRKPTAPARRPRLEGVRLLVGSDGQTILVGKGGPENDRLTFKLAAPEDFWFHALGVPGAHVVVRNEGRLPRPADSMLREAAAIAAWYSEAKKDGEVDVQWTRRKYVRRLKGARPGTVTVKKSQTVRVSPGLPASSERASRP